jgi:hypothetical protein
MAQCARLSSKRGLICSPLVNTWEKTRKAATSGYAQRAQWRSPNPCPWSHFSLIEAWRDSRPLVQKEAARP